MENLRKEAQGLPVGLDSMIKKEVIEARAQGVEQILRTPEAFIKDLDDTIEQMTEESDPQE